MSDEDEKQERTQKDTEREHTLKQQEYMQKNVAYYQALVSTWIDNRTNRGSGGGGVRNIGGTKTTGEVVNVGGVSRLKPPEPQMPHRLRKAMVEVLLVGVLAALVVKKIRNALLAQ